jgi:N-dimethylarginine dimethylaminohydrolase
MPGVWSTNDWDPLEEVILGTARGFTLPFIDISTRHFFEPPAGAAGEQVSCAQLQRVIEETEEDIADLTSILVQAGVKVRRPDPSGHCLRFATPAWESVSAHALMPRDCIAVIGDRIVEVPMPMRARFFEVLPFRRLLREYFDQGAVWLSAPKPELPLETYTYETGRSVVANIEPLFDAANLLRCGRDIFFNVSNTGNRAGAEWLRRMLGSDFRVHEISISSDHLGTTLQILRPGLLLANSARLDPARIPPQLKGWKTIWVDTPEDDGYAFGWPRASVWVGMNILALAPDRAIVPGNQRALIGQLERAGVEPGPAPFRHGRTLGGGLHCCSLDVRRAGTLETYL